MPQKRIYLNSLSTILATSTSRNSFITWAQGKGFNTFLYYDLRSWLNPTSTWGVGNTTNAQTLGNFIAQARTAGVTSHVAVMSEIKAFASGSTNSYPNWETEDYQGIYAGTSGATGIGGHKLINSFNAYMLSASSSNTNKIFKSTQGANGTTDFSGLNLELEYWWDHTLKTSTAPGINKCSANSIMDNVKVVTTLGSTTVTIVGCTTTGTNSLGLQVGMKVWSPNLPTDTTISTIVNSTTITVNKRATATSTTTTPANAQFGGNVYPDGVTIYGYQVWQRTNLLTEESKANLEVWWKVCDLYQRWAKLGGNGKNSAYCGWWLPAGTEVYQCDKIVRYMDSLDLHVYRAATGNSQTLISTVGTTNGYAQRMFDFVKSRLTRLADAQAALNPSGVFKIHFIYSMEGDFSGPWMSANPSVTFDALHNAVVSCFNNWTGTGSTNKARLLIDGYTIFQQSLARTVRP